jgi:hypothetical protein
VAHIVEHVRCEHRSPPVQTVPHAPQFAGSETVLTHVAPHGVRPAVHEHVPFKQLWPFPQALLHMPQWRMSFATDVHVPLHAS